jgi:DNA-binding response OmpR family regulator
MNHVLVIDDDRVLVDLLREFLATEGFTVDAAYDYASGIARGVDAEHDLIVLDVMLPDGSGLELLKTLRASSKVPVLLLSAAGETADRIIGLQIGADDYLAKPFEVRELAARVHAILRRTRDVPKDVPKNESEIKIGDLALSASRRAVSRSKIPVELTAVEFDLLECLLRNAGSIVTRETLAERALGRKLTAFDRSLDVHMHNLRKKISARTDERIKTIRGVGYIYASLPQDVE